MMKTVAFLFFCLTLFSCRNGTTSDGVAMAIDSLHVDDTVYVDIKGTEHKFLGRIPDSLRTEEQVRLLRLMNDITVDHISVKDNHMVLELSRDEFLAKGIPERYYKILQRNIVDNNIFFDTSGIKNVDELMRLRNEEYEKYIRESDNKLKQ